MWVTEHLGLCHLWVYSTLQRAGPEHPRGVDSVVLLALREARRGGLVGGVLLGIFHVLPKVARIVVQVRELIYKKSVATQPSVRKMGQSDIKWSILLCANVPLGPSLRASSHEERIPLGCTFLENDEAHFLHLNLTRHILWPARGH